MADNSKMVKDMLAASVHIGNSAALWSPKMRDYIYGTQNGVHVFDLYKTADLFEKMKSELSELSKAGKDILIVGTKIQVRDLVKSLAEATGHHYVNTGWVPGLLTNFSTIKKRILDYNRLVKDVELGNLDKLPKKEKASEMRKLERLEKAYSGVRQLKRMPDAILVIDGRHEALALKEAKLRKIPSYAFLGTTGDIDMADCFVPGNVHTAKSIQFFVDALAPIMKKGERKVVSSKKKEMLSSKKSLDEKPSKENKISEKNLFL